ncbi:cupin [filamentous cyanobacterium CCP5]|nr:cupin [filamentous cyanobacterium CCP5]
MNTRPHPHPLLSAQVIAAMPEQIFVHPLNPKAVRHTRSLGQGIGFEHIGLHLVRVAPGDESTEFHTHQIEEEFLYILSGRGLAEIGNQTVEVGAGDFMGFVAGGLPHAMRNPFTADLVYLAGGLHLEYDICDYPRQAKRIYRTGDRRTYVSVEDQATG